MAPESPPAATTPKSMNIEETPAYATLVSSFSTDNPPLISIGRFKSSGGHAVLGMLLLVGLAVRSVVVFQSTKLIHSDEVFQYLEQGHRLAFGSGVVPWEYDYGVRSWVLPAAIAAIMKVCSWISTSPLLYIYSLRAISAALSLAVIVFGFQTVLHRAGLLWATITGFFCATWFHAINLSPAMLTEVLAAYAMFPAVYLASDGTHSMRKALLLGAVLGITLCVRFQMIPALAVIAAWYCRTDLRHKWLPVILAGLAVVTLLAGVVDTFALGRPFQSIWLNFYFNALQGVSTTFGSRRWFTYFDYLTSFESIAAIPLGVLVLVGCYRAPLLALTALTIVVSHSFFGHKEYRFIAFSLLSLPVLTGHGASIVSEALRQYAGKISWLVTTSVLAVSVPIASMIGWASGLPTGYRPNSHVLRLFLAAQDQVDLCGLGVSDYQWSATGGYTYLNRQIPLYFSAFLQPTARPGYYIDDSSYRRSIQLAVHVVLDHRTIPQFPGDALFQHTNAFNYLIAMQGKRVEGYKPLTCASSAATDAANVCLLKRPGRCSPP